MLQINVLKYYLFFFMSILYKMDNKNYLFFFILHILLHLIYMVNETILHMYHIISFHRIMYFINIYNIHQDYDDPYNKIQLMNIYYFLI